MNQRGRRRSAVITGIAGTILLAALAPGCRKDVPLDGPSADGGGYEPGEELGGGATTTFDLGQNAFNHPAANLTDEEGSTFVVGNSFFTQNWVTAPSSTTGRDGLGPLFNAQSCSGCHLRDGRGRPAASAEGTTGFLLRLSVPGSDLFGGPAPHPTYGTQFQPLAILGVPNEGGFSIAYEPVPGTFADGTPYMLQRPSYTIAGAYGPIDDALVSPRVAQQLCGMGLLEAIPAFEILANQHIPNGDGVSGRANYVHDVALNATVLGRFGWKANEPSVRQQTAGAFNGDIGITSSLFPSDQCTSAQHDCLDAINGNDPGNAFELAPQTLDNVAFYTATLGVPVRRNAQDPTVLKGKALFTAAGCATCHRPAYVTGASAISPALAHQRIFPYTDLLLHDMGPGLADGRTDHLADGNEWRTPPLWGIGLFQTTNGHTRYLHDGRARDLTEAILWHGGEGAAAQERFRNMTASERQALLAFLHSL